MIKFKGLVGAGLVVVFMAFWLLSSGSAAVLNSENQELSRGLLDLTANLNESALKLFNHQLENDLNSAAAKPQNIFISPLSVQLVLAMVWSGAGGETADQISTGFGFLPSAEENLAALAELQQRLKQIEDTGLIKLHAANSLWIDREFKLKDSYINRVNKGFDGGLELVDFVNAADAAANQINTWVADKTAGKITGLIPPGSLDSLTRLVLVNAIYFKGDWQDKFQKSATGDEPFYLSGGGTVTVPLMNRQDDFRYGEDSDLQLIELPYRGGQLSMVVLLPTASGSILDLRKRLSAAQLKTWLDASWVREVNLFLPRFKLTYGVISLAKSLKQLGITAAFNAAAADFSLMTADADGLMISEVFHKAFVEVNEEGTEAAAATATAMMPTSVALPPDPPKVFRADRPFIFLIRENSSGLILFVGLIENPRT